MKIGLADVYAELTKQAWKQWEKEFPSRATAKEWNDTSPPCRDLPTGVSMILPLIHGVPAPTTS